MEIRLGTFLKKAVQYEKGVGNIMQSLIVTEKGANTKIEQYIQAAYPDLSFGVLQKAFRRRDIKVNGTRVSRDYIVVSGDKLEIYITDELLYCTGNTGKTASEGKFTVAYEDDNLIIVNKAQGIPVHPDRKQSHETLIDLVRAYLRERDGQQIAGHKTDKRRADQQQTNTHQAEVKQAGGHQCDKQQTDKQQTGGQHTKNNQAGGQLIGITSPDIRTQNGRSFQPELCHRLDRNTGGLVIIAKNKASHDFIIEKLESREIKKYYQCLVAGRMEKKEACLHAYLWKDAAKSRVFISDRKKTGAQEIITAYKVLKYDRDNDISRLEIELITGRTHQIRAHMAYIGHPVIGDGKYGKNTINRTFGLKRQALWAYRLKFDFFIGAELMKSNKHMDSNEMSEDNKLLTYSDFLNKLKD